MIQRYTGLIGFLLIFIVANLLFFVICGKDFDTADWVIIIGAEIAGLTAIISPMLYSKQGDDLTFVLARSLLSSIYILVAICSGIALHCLRIEDSVCIAIVIAIMVVFQVSNAYTIMADISTMKSVEDRQSESKAIKSMATRVSIASSRYMGSRAEDILRLVDDLKYAPTKTVNLDKMDYLITRLESEADSLNDEELSKLLSDIRHLYRD